MSTNDRDRNEKLENIDARLARHEKATRMSLVWLIILATALLALMGYHMAHL